MARNGDFQRQCDRLRADQVPRLIGIAISCAVFGLFLPTALVGLVFATALFLELAQTRVCSEICRQPKASLGVLLTIISTAGSANYCTPAIVMWKSGVPLAPFLATMSIVGLLVHIVSVRSAHLVFGLATSLPPAIVILWFPLHHVGDADWTRASLAGTAGSLAVLGYFAAAFLQNYHAQAALAQAVERADAASAAKSRFLAAISHEMRTPLNTILGLGQLLRDSDAPAGLRAQSASADAAASSLRLMVEDALDLASESQGDLVHRPVAFDTRAELRRIGATLGLYSGGAPNSVMVEITDGVPRVVVADPRSLRKMLGHLLRLVRGADLAHALPARIAVDLAASAPDRLSFRVWQPGPAPGPDQAEMAEEPLGLTLLRRLATLSGASLDLPTSGPDGSVARLTLPFTRSPEASTRTDPATIQRALVVDDLATNRFIVMQLLRGLGIDAVEATGGRDALHELNRAPFDVVLLDMAMPGMRGEDVFRAIRAAEAPWRQIPVIALTAEATDDRRAELRALGLNGFVAKPVDSTALAAEIRTATAARSSRTF